MSPHEASTIAADRRSQRAADTVDRVDAELDTAHLGPPARREPIPAGRRVLAIEFQPGDVVHLPYLDPEDGTLRWSDPVRIRDVTVLDTELVQVRWDPEPGADPFPAHRLLIGETYAAGAVVVP